MNRNDHRSTIWPNWLSHAGVRRCDHAFRTGLRIPSVRISGFGFRVSEFDFGQGPRRIL